jgi:hypothetical protein
MSRALVTFATGAYRACAEIARPGLEQYAERHEYELLDRPPTIAPRPASWMKLPLLANALDRYDEVLWLDADVVVCDPNHDLADDVPQEAWQALVRHHTPDGEVPNCGVWYLRHQMHHVLEQLWTMERYLDHPWWEQGALLELLGYQGRPVELVAPTELCWHTHWLPLEWNSHEERDRHPSPRFAHATCGPLGWRLAIMARYAEKSNRVKTPSMASSTTESGTPKTASLGSDQK